MRLRTIILEVIGTIALVLPIWATPELVQLPEFRVEGTPWRYAQMGDIEVLTRGSEGRARAFVAALIRGKRLLPEYATEGARLPLRVVLVEDAFRPVARLSRLHSGYSSQQDWSKGYVRMHGEHVDGVADGVHVIALNLDGIDEVWMILVNYVRQLVLAQNPALPTWFTCGLFGPSGPLRQVIGLPRSTTVQLPKLSWPDPATPPGTFPPEASELPRFEVMFDPNRQSDEALVPTEKKKFDFQSGLFARWSLFGPAKKGRNRSGYWAFAEMARRGQATETIFRECYGMDWTQACAEMRAYMIPKHTGMLEVRMPDVMADVPEGDRLEFRDATAEEVRRFLGDLSRLHAPEGVRKRQPKNRIRRRAHHYGLIFRQFRRK